LFAVLKRKHQLLLYADDCLKMSEFCDCFNGEKKLLKLYP